MEVLTRKLGNTDNPNHRMLDDIRPEATNHASYIEGWNEARAMVRTYWEQYVADYA